MPKNLKNNNPGLGKSCPLYETGSYSEFDTVEFLDNNDIQDQVRARTGCYWTGSGDFRGKPVWRRDKEGAITPPLKIKCDVDYSEVSDRLYKKCPSDPGLGPLAPGNQFNEPSGEAPPPPGFGDLFDPENPENKDCDPSPESDSQPPSTGPDQPPQSVTALEPSFFREGPAPFGTSPNITVYFFDGAVVDGYRYVTGSTSDTSFGGPGQFQKPNPIEYGGQLYYELKRQNPGGGFEGQPSIYVRNIDPNEFGIPELELSLSETCNNIFTGTTAEDNCVPARPDAPNLRSDYMIVSINPFPNSSSDSDREFRYYNFSTGQVINTDSQNPFQPKFNILKDSDEFFTTKQGYRLYKVREQSTGSGSKVFTFVYIPPASQEELLNNIGPGTPSFTPFPIGTDPSLLDFVVIEADKMSPVFKEKKFTENDTQQFKQSSTDFPDVLFQSLICGGEYKGKTYSPGVVLGEWYEDHTFSYEVPYSKRESEQLGGVGAIMYASVDPFYNFYIEKYEDTAAVDTINETLLPNLYSMKALFEYEEANNQPDNILNPSYRKLLTLDEFVKYQQVVSSFTSQGQIIYNYSEKPLDFKNAKGQYFDQWGRQVERELGTLNGPQNFLSIVNPIGQKYSNLAVTHSNVNFLKDADIKRELFPTYVEIEFSTTKNTPFSNLLEQTEFSGLVLNELISGRGRFIKEFNFAEFAALKYPQPIDDVDATSLVSYEPREQLSFVTRNGIDVLEWLAALKQDLQDQAQQGNTSVTPYESIESVEGPSAVFLGDMKDIVKLGPDSKNLFYKAIVISALEAKVTELIQQNTRSYCDIVNGELATSETIFYRIEKRRGGINGEVVQNIYLPNSTEIDVLKFIDTQVKYGEQYTYNIYAYELVYGSRYRYEDYILGDDIAGVNVTTEPSLKLLQVPYYTYTNVILDSPPVAPDVNIIPFRGVNNRIKIAFNSNVGSCEKYPEIIEPSEAAQIKLLLASQDKYEGEKLLYESDDQSTEYEVWRMETQPFGYEDFSGRKIKTLVTDIDKDTTQKPTSGAVIDIIEPNKKYWYVFRSIDVHGHKSYPSPVYEIELVDDLGGVFPQIKVVDFATKIPKVPTKSAKRMIHVVPKLAHAIVNEEESGLIGKDSVLDRWFYGQFKLGVKDETLWGKKFKIRFTSAKTCRKVDVNFTFKTRHRKIEPE